MLLRAHAAFGDECYRVAALKAAEFMLIDMDNGGVSSHDGGELFLEEYPQRPRRSVMNGWVFSLFGLYDASLVDARFAGPFKHSAETLACHLDDYDAGFWSYYDQERRIASPRLPSSTYSAAPRNGGSFRRRKVRGEGRGIRALSGISGQPQEGDC